MKDIRCRTALFVYVAASVLSVAFAQNSESPPDRPSGEEILKRIEKALAGVETVKTGFVQKKKLAVFDRTMTIRGEMAVANPGRMAWRVHEPVKYTMVIEGARLVQWDEDTDKVQTLHLDKDPAFQAVFEQLTVWFSGRYGALTENYNLRVAQTDPYILLFTPKAGTMFEKMIESVRVVFRKDARYIKQLTIEEGSADRTVIRFHNTRLNVPLDEDTWEVRSR